MEGIDRETRRAARSISVLVFGNNADEIELAALDVARPFFGGGVRLEVVRNWNASANADVWSRVARTREQAADKTYSAHITVRTVEPDPS
jgi:hypothetical protein